MALAIRPRCAYIPEQQGRWPIMPLKFGTAEHWRKRAEEARTMAQQIDDPAAKREMLEIAANYEKIASVTESRLAREQQSEDQALED